MTILGFQVDAKGRVALPREVRRIAHVQPNTRLVGRVEAGRIILETPDMVEARIWGRTAAGVHPTAAAAVAAAVPDSPIAAEREAAALRERERPAGGPALDEVGEELLADLGL